MSDRVALVLDPVQRSAAFFKRVAEVLDPVRAYGFTELSASPSATIAPGANLRMAEQAPVEQSSIPAFVLPQPIRPADRRPDPGIRELISLFRRVVLRYWHDPQVARIRRLVLGLLGKEVPVEPPLPVDGSELVRRDNAALLRELESLEGDVIGKEQSRSEAEAAAAAASNALSRFKSEIAHGVHRVAASVGLATAWAIVVVAVSFAAVVAFIVSPTYPLPGDNGNLLRWLVAGAIWSGGAAAVAASTASLLGPLSGGLAQRLGTRLTGRIEAWLSGALRVS